MKNNRFIMSTTILMISAFFTKLLGFIIKIFYTRILGEYAISIYSLIMPTYSLLITIATFSLPISLSKLVAETNNKRKLIINTIIIILVLNIILISTTILLSSTIANLLNEEKAKYLLIACSLTLPFISISSMIKGYFFGIQKMHPYAISNVIEQIIRLSLIYFILPILMNYNYMYALLGLILLSIISEISSIIVFMFFLPKKIKLTNIKPEKCIIKNILDISIPTMSSRIIGNISYFFEPIILTNLLLLSGYSKEYILLEYGTYNAYSIGLLVMPTFFINALCQALVPEISKNKNNKKLIKRRIKQSLSFSFILGLIFSLTIFIYSKNLLSIIFNTTRGIKYTKILSVVFVLFYLESPLMSILQALNKSLSTMKITTYGVVIKLLFLTLLSLCHIGIYSLLISEIINIIFVVSLSLVTLKKAI